MSNWNLQEKSGAGDRFYDEANIFYDELIDFASGNDVYYDGTGASTTWTNQTKS